MANISTLLARILSTRYGRDMRQDLHDAIEAVNDDTETALGKSLAFTTNTRKLKLLAKDNTLLSEVVIPGGGSGGGSVDSVNGLFPDENGNVEVNLDDINDVDITSAEDGDALIYDSTSGKWINGAGGGGTTDYTQLTNKPSINGVTLSGNKTSADLGISGGGSNENLLNNGWFTVNSKKLGGVSLTTSEQILVDDWKAYRSSGGSSYVDIRSTGLAIFPSLADDYTALRQYLDISVIGQTLTLSVKFDDGIHSWTFTPTSASEYYYSSIWTYNSCTVQFMFNNNEVSLLLKKTVNEDRYITLRAVKMEIGNGSTLATDYLPNYDIESIKCNGVMRSNRNLLDNPWFTVNQKGFTSGNAAQNSTPIDRWQVRFNATTLALISSGLNITNSNDNHGLVQILDMPTDYVNTYTFSMKTSDGTIYTKTGKFQTDTSGHTQVISSPFPVYMGLWTIGGKLAPAVYLSGNSSTGSFTITAMKLELGTESTLHLDTAPDYASELLKCQRYYYPLSGKSYNSMVSAMQQTRQFMTITLPTEMRAVPTFNGSLTTEGISGSTRVDDTVTSSNITVTNKQDIEFNFTTSNNFNLCSSARVSFLSGSYLSAEL